MKFFALLKQAFGQSRRTALTCIIICIVLFVGMGFGQINNGSSDYPSSIDTYLPEVNDPYYGATKIDANAFNGVYDAITNMQTELGTDVAGSETDLKTRLAHAMDGDGNYGEIRMVGASFGFTTIDDAIADLGSSGGMIYVSPGTYSISSTMTIPSNTRITGAGRESEIKLVKTSSTAVSVFTLTDVSNIILDNLYINGNGTAMDAAGYSAEHDHAISIACDSSYGNIWIHDCVIENMAGDGIYWGKAENVFITNNVIDNPNRSLTGPLSGRNCISIIGTDQWCKHGIITGNVLNGGYPGAIDLETNYGEDYTIEDIVISNNVINGSDGYGVALVANQTDAEDSSVVKNIIINDNVFRNTTEAAVYLVQGASGGVGIVEKVTISNNIIDNCLSSGGDRAGSIELRKSVDVSIVGNIISNAGKAGIYLQHESDRVNIHNNRVFNCQTTGIRVGGTSGSEIEFCSVKSNQVYNNGQAAADTYDAIYLSYFDRSVVGGNLCFDDQDTPTQRFGLHFLYCDSLALGEYAGWGNTDTKIRLSNCTNFKIQNLMGIGPFAFDSLAAGQAYTRMKIDDIGAGAPMLTDGDIWGVSLFSSTAVTGDTIKVLASIDGGGNSGHYCYLTTGTTNYRIAGDVPKPFYEGDELGLVIQGGAALTPDGTACIRGWLWVVFN